MKRLLQKEDGFILITSMVVLMILSFIGIAGTRNTTVELQIAGNDKTIKELFYDAESAAMESAGLMNNEKDPDELIAKRTSKPWITPPGLEGKDPVGRTAKELADTWKSDTWVNENTFTSGIQPVTGGKIIKLSVVDRGIVKGKKASSIKITSTSVHGYHLYGYAARQKSWDMVEVGYRKRF